VDRRAFLSTVAGSLLAAPLAAEGQPAGKVWRIGILQEGPDKNLNPEAPMNGFVDGLRELGYVEGQNLVIEYRYTNNEPERIPEFAAELARLKLDVIATTGTTETAAAKAATATIPIVMLFVGDPVGAGLVRSLTHPGTNVTGTSMMLPDLGGKRLELLREIVPKLRRVAILWNSRNASAAAEMRATETAARSLGLTVYSAAVDSASRLDAAFAGMARARPDGVLVMLDALTRWHRREIAAAALSARLPSVVPSWTYVESGGLVGYGPDYRAIAGRAASYVDKILKGAKPADLPVEQPTKFELVINLKTAKALGLTIPPSLLQRADQVIE
jgi:putative ABC transport system substrate-binding protein